MKHIQYIIQITAPFIAPEVVSNPPTLLYQKAIFLVLALMVITISSFGSIFFYASIDAAVLAVFSAIIFLTCLLSLGLLHFSRNIHQAANILVLGLLIANTAAVLQTGGIFSIIIFSFAPVAILGLVFSHRRKMAQIVFVSVAIVLVLMILEANGFTPKPVYKIQESWLWFGIIMILLIIGTVGTFFFLDAIREKAYEQLEQERNSVEERILEATQKLQNQQHQISLINEHLEERNTELQQAIQTAEAAQKLQADVLRNIDHEMRTPLSIILGFAEILQEEVTSQNPELVTFVEQISHAGENLLGIFNNAKILTTVESSDFALSPKTTILPSLLQQLAGLFHKEAAQKGLAISYSWSPECEEPVLLDEEYVQIMLRQVLSNAVKFTKQGSVQIQCAIMRSKSGKGSVLEFRVVDTGVGIAAEFMDKIFMPFQQQDASTTRRFGGLGLGLAVVLPIVNAMNGKVWCESVVGKGTTFIVELPLAE